jgi:vacuolar-type H+-ATPase subunit I/STV1
MGFFGKVITVVWAYVAWSMIASSLDPKKKQKIKKIRKDGWDVLKFLFDDFVETHKKLLESAKEEILSPENKKIFEKKKKELVKIAEKYKKEAEKLLKELQKKWKEKAKEGLVKIEEIYEEQKVKIDEIKEVAPEKAQELKQTLLASAKEIKDEIVKKIKS